MVHFGLSLGLPTSADLLPSIAKEVSNSEDYPDIFAMPDPDAASNILRNTIKYLKYGNNNNFH